MKLCIVGPYPPPYGGVSNHICRLLPYLSESNIQYNVFNQYDVEDRELGVKSTRGSYVWWLKFLFIKEKHLVHFHQFSWFHFIYFFVYSVVNKNDFIITIHNEKLLNAPAWIRFLAVSLLRWSRFRKLLVVSKSVETMLIHAGVDNVCYLPAYVPPRVSSKSSRDVDGKTIFFNIWKVSCVGDISRYGIDLLMVLALKYPGVRFECFIAVDENINLIESVIKDKGAFNLILRIGENLVEHFYRADVFLRLNRDDAYGISIQEAMDCGVPAIASDVCARPDGVKLFKSGNIDELLAVFDEVLSSPKNILLQGKVDMEYHLQLIGLYKKLLAEK